MKVILLEDVKSLGEKGQIVDVSDGYAENFILKKKLGRVATNNNLNDWKLKKVREEKIAAQQLEAAKELAAMLEGKTVSVKIRAGEGGKVFGSVTGKEIAAAYQEQYGMEIDRKKIQLPDAIRAFGLYQIPIKLHPQVVGQLSVNVQEA